jgi:hypothetical protein
MKNMILRAALVAAFAGAATAAFAAPRTYVGPQGYEANYAGEVAFGASAPRIDGAPASMNTESRLQVYVPGEGLRWETIETPAYD